jgi:hypothetical protein
VQVEARLEDVSGFEELIGNEIQKDLLAIWVGGDSLLGGYFSQDWVGRFVGKCQTSVLVMR